MRKATAVIVGLVVLAGLTACGQTDKEKLDALVKEAQFSQTCVDNGGRIYYDGYNDIQCSFTTKED